ncbi:MAG TPA: hypothetical protein VF088_07155 [Pyrinomonadaceae bacterium]
MGVNRAKTSIRLSSAAREYASYIEKARMYSIRRHADDESERANITINPDRTSYNVTIDSNGDGVMDTVTIPLPDGVKFETAETIGFDWRGRTWNTVGGVASPNAQVSIRLKNDVDSISIDVTGSGDVTVDSKVFDDSVPDIKLKVGDLASGATPVATPSSTIPYPSPTVLPTPDTSIVPSPIPSPSIGQLPVPTPSVTATPTPSASPVATATPTPRPGPTATPTPAPAICTISTSLPSLKLSLNGSATINVSHNASTSLAITGISSRPTYLQVSPSAQTVGAGGSTSFTVKSKKLIGTYSITFNSSCGSKTVSVLVVALL